MHDKNGTQLKVGDEVILRARITSLNEGDEYCNVGLVSIHGRRPDGLKETIHSLNTGVLALIDRPEAEVEN